MPNRMFTMTYNKNNSSRLLDFLGEKVLETSPQLEKPIPVVALNDENESPVTRRYLTKISDYFSYSDIALFDKRITEAFLAHGWDVKDGTIGDLVLEVSFTLESTRYWDKECVEYDIYTEISVVDRWWSDTSPLVHYHFVSASEEMTVTEETIQHLKTVLAEKLSYKVLGDDILAAIDNIAELPNYYTAERILPRMIAVPYY